ncbi:MAG: pyridoxal phosphate-dependent decarboxylase family protein [Geminicoccaceae bacterium]
MLRPKSLVPSKPNSRSDEAADDFDVLRQVAAEAIDYRRSVDDRPLRPDADYHQMVRAFDRPLPEDGLAAGATIENLIATAEPGLNGMTGARFFGWVLGGSHPVGVAADWLASAWGQNCGNHHAAPAAAAIEDVASRWLLDILDLPRACSVGFVTGATAANFVGLAAARHALLASSGWDVEKQGLFGAPPINVLVGNDAHATIFSALQFIGLGSERVTRLPTDDSGRIIVPSFLSALARCQGPTIVIAQAGQINTGAFDPFSELAAACRQRPDTWLHVDGAFGLWARASKAKAHLTAGIDGADSWATDGHKWLQVPFESGYVIVKDREAHRAAMTVAASYLPDCADHERNPTDYVPELSRRARGFATWAMIRHLGRRGIAAMIERHCRLARQMADRLAKEPGIEILNDVDLNQIIVRFGNGRQVEEDDDLTRAVIDRIQQDGTCFAGGASWRGRWVMRISCISCSTTAKDACRAVDAMIQAWRSVSDADGTNVRMRPGYQRSVS